MSQNLSQPQIQNEPQYYVQKNGQQFGPYLRKDIIENLRTGQYSDTDLACQTGMQNWVPLSNLIGKNPTNVLEQFGFHPTVAGFTILIDLVVFGGTIVTVGFGWFFFVILAFALGFIAYNGQKNWYGDNHSDSLTKAVMVAVLTGIPLPIATALMAYKKLTGGILEKKPVRN
jgi:hypothetical protein